MRGCAMCSLQTLRRFKGSDDELLAMYREALDQVRAYLGASQQVPATYPVTVAQMV